MLVVDPFSKEIPQALKTTKEKVLVDKNIHKVVVVTPELTHAEVVAECLEAGKDVFVEKPLCVNAKDAKYLLELAVRKKRILYVDYIFLYDPALKIIKKELPQIEKITSRRFNPGFNRKDLAIYHDAGIHDLYIAEKLFGQKIISARHRDRQKKNKQVVAGDITFVTKSKKQMIAEYSWTAKKLERVMTVYGGQRMLEWRKFEKGEEMLIYDINKKKKQLSKKIIISTPPTALTASLQRFLSLKSMTNLSFPQQAADYLRHVRVLESCGEYDSTF